MFPHECLIKGASKRRAWNNAPFHLTKLKKGKGGVREGHVEYALRNITLMNIYTHLRVYNKVSLTMVLLEDYAERFSEGGIEVFGKGSYRFIMDA